MGAKGPNLQPNLARLREDAGLTQLKLSQIVGVTETTIANWERGRSGTEWFERFILLCAALRCEPQDLLEGAAELVHCRLLASPQEAVAPKAASAEGQRRSLSEVAQIASEPKLLTDVAALADESERSKPSELDDRKE